MKFFLDIPQFDYVQKVRFVSGIDSVHRTYVHSNIQILPFVQLKKLYFLQYISNLN